MWLGRYLTVGALLSGAALAQVDMAHLREGSFAGAAPSGQSLQIVNWNIARGVELDKVTTFLEKAQPDVAVLQEVDVNARRSAWKDVAEVLAKALHLNYSFGPAFNELTQSKQDELAIQGQATLSRWPITSSRILRYSAQSSFWQPKSYLPTWSILQRREGGRVALVSELKADGRRIVVYNLHLESRSGSVQEQQLGETLEDMRQYPVETPVLLVGDFNSKYHPKVMLQRLQKAGFTSCFGDQVMRTHVLLGWVDWIFVRGPLTCSDAEVHRKATGSDHFPLTARVSWK